jgi:hypothetical protein
MFSPAVPAIGALMIDVYVLAVLSWIVGELSVSTAVALPLML